MRNQEKQENLLEIVQNAQIAKEQAPCHIAMRYGTMMSGHSYYYHGYNAFYVTPSRNYIDKNFVDGILLYRHAPIAVQIQQVRNVGEDLACRLPRSIVRGKLCDRLDYEEHIVETDDGMLRSFNTLSAFLRKLQETEQEREQAKLERERLQKEREEADRLQKTAQEKAELTRQITQIKEREKELEGQKEKLRKISDYIRNAVQLKFKPIVDPMQSKAKFGYLYDGKTLVLSGGPGTGKTTTMIAHLKYITDIFALDEDAKLEEGERKFKLSTAQRAYLTNCIETDKDWIFFSPSDLLRSYLEHAMVEEGLSKPTSKVYTWERFCSNLMGAYGFFTPEKRPFVNDKHSEELLISQGSNAIESLERFYIKRLCQAIKNLPPLPTAQKSIIDRFLQLAKRPTKNAWITIATGVQTQLAKIKDETSIKEVVQLLQLLNTNYAQDSKTYKEQLDVLIRKVSDEVILPKIKRDKTLEEKMMAFLKQDKNTQETEESENEEVNFGDDDNEEGDDAIDLITNNDDDERLKQLIKGWVRAYTLHMRVESIHLNKRQESLSEIILPLLSDEDKKDFPTIGDLTLFQCYAVYTQAPAKTMLRQMSTVYKAFRRQIVKTRNPKWNIRLLQDNIKSNKLHLQEQSLLVGFINNLIKQIRHYSTNLNGKYIDAYQQYVRPIIGIDEATDFSEVEIYAMSSFAYDDFQSITIAGDLMQRMTNRGLHSWSDLDKIVPQKDVVSLKVSYRQSRNMLKVAKDIYQDSLGEEPKYETYFKDKNVPKALAYIDKDEEQKINWISQRIREVYYAYGKQLPSIAIFLNSKKQAAEFAERLEDIGSLSDWGITVVDGSNGNTLGQKDQVRVYSIHDIKGMEFDVVFFHNIDDVEVDDDLLKRYLYVGVSRAAFFLGATFREDRPDISKYFLQNANWSNLCND